MDPALSPEPGKRRFFPASLTGALLLAMGVCAGVSLLPSLFAQGGDRKPAPPAFPPPITLGASPTPIPASPEAASPTPSGHADTVHFPVTKQPAPFIPPTVNLDPDATPTPPPPRTINGNPAPGEAQIPGGTGPVATPTGLPGLPPTPIELPPTVILTAEERNGTGLGPHMSVANDTPGYSRAGLPPRNWIDQTQSEADAKSSGCLECHHGVEPMHKSKYVVLGCTDCHGGDATRGAKDVVVDGVIPGHVKPVYAEYWRTAANPAESAAILNHESPEFVRFVNPGDLRVAQQACGLCHEKSFEHVTNSMMNSGQMLWGAALYNNGGYWKKNYVFGQFYGRDGAPLRADNPFPVTAEDTLKRGILPFIGPLPRFNLSQPGNTLRVFEKGGVNPGDLANPDAHEKNGAPERALSARGFGSLLRTDPVFLGLQKTRLNDPLLGFMGTNDHPGDYRSSGCTACHTIYANDRSPTNSGWYSKYGNQGLSFSADPTMNKKERGHPVSHQFTRSIPSSQCMNCHMHQGNLFVNPYLGYTWWDQESDGEFMYPKKQYDPTDSDLVENVRRNPEAAAARGLWKDLNFLEKVAELNPKLKNTQFADYHGHGWIFKAIFKKDRKGNMLDLADNKIAADDPNKWKKAVHLKDIHLQNGMQCVDCHFLRDVHGDGTLYNEPRAATSIECIDCHGTVDKRPTLTTSGNGGKVDLAAGGTPFGPRFVWENKQVTVTQTVNGQPMETYATRPILYQYSNMDPNKRWEVPQTVDTVDPTSSMYNARSAYAKTLHRDGVTWGDVPGDTQERHVKLAHNNEAITCQVCHSSWATSCFGCHLPMKANMKMPLNKYEGITDRNFTTYNPQVVRDDVFMLGIDGTVKNHRMAVLRSSSAVVVSSQNANREWVYSQQQTVSAEGYSGQAFNPHFPHTTSGVGTTKGCTDCHMSAQKDNNAWMAQLLGFGTGTVNFFGRYAWVGAGKEIRGVIWTEPEEPQAAIGSHFHKISYPKNYEDHLANNSILKTGYEHKAADCRELTQRGEFLYTANGKGGIRVYDIAQIDNKAFSERFNTSPTSPIGQNMHVQTKGICTSLALPSTLGLDPTRTHLAENEETPIPLYYGFIYATDTVEGLVEVLVATLVDGRPDNNFLHKDVVFNPDGLLTGATNVVAAGGRLYITAPSGLSVVDVQDPLHPKLAGHYGGDFLKNPRSCVVQFQYAFVSDEEGVKVLNIADPNHPVPIPGARVSLGEAGKMYIARTYLYVADGKEGMAIVDVERPDHPRLTMMYDAEGRMNDVQDIKIGSVAQSMFALVADGKNGFRVVQMISPENVPENAGFSPKPAPILIATYPVEDAQAIGRGLDRDRVVDETGAQTVVFGRRGSRPFNLSEMLPFLRHGDVDGDGKDAHRNGAWYHVEDVVVKKDKDGKQTLLTKSGADLSAPVAFVNPAGTPTPVLGAPMMSPNGQPMPMPVPGSYPPLPEQGSGFMNGQDVQRLLRTMDPTRPPEQPPGMVPAPPPSPAPTPAGPANPFMQQGAVDRLEHVKEQSPAASSPAPAPDAMATPGPLAAPEPTVAPSGNPFLQDNTADRLSRLRQKPAPAASPVPTGSPR